MAGIVGAEAYRHQVHELLPSGRAWPRHPGTLLDALVVAVASRLAALDLDALALLDDILPGSTRTLLADWERVVGLPDDCSPLAPSIAERRGGVVTKLVTERDLSPETFRRIGRRFGLDVTIRELEEAEATAATSLDTSGGRWRYVWWALVSTSTDAARFDALSPVTTPLLVVERNTELECRLQAAAPAHTLLLVGYDTVPGFLTAVPPTIEAYRGAPVSYTFPVARGGNEPYVYSLRPATEADVPGMAFDHMTRIWSGRPTDESVTAMIYTVSDAQGDEETESFDFEVTAPPDLTLPALSSYSARRLRSFEITLPEAMGGVQPIIYSLAPAVQRMTFDPATRIWSGTPAPFDDGTAGAYGSFHAMTYTASDDAGQEVSGTFGLTIT